MGGAANAYPVLLELDVSGLRDLDVPAFGTGATPAKAPVQADSAGAWAPAGPIPASAIRSIHFRSTEELDEHQLRRFDNVSTDLPLEATPALFSSEAARPGLLDWLRQLPPALEQDGRAADQVSGAITLLAADLPAHDDAFAVLRDLLSVRGGGNRPRKTGPRYAEWLLALVSGPRRGATLDERLFTACVSALGDVRPSESWRPLEILADVQAELKDKRMSADERKTLDRHFEGIEAILRNDRDFRPFRPDAGLTSAKALLMTLMRPGPTDLLQWPTDESGADEVTRITATALAGFIHGRKRISTTLRTPTLDDYLAQQEADVTAPEKDTVVTPPLRLQLQATAERLRLVTRAPRTTLIERTREQLTEETSEDPASQAEAAPEYVRALAFAVRAHGAQARKGTRFP